MRTFAAQIADQLNLVMLTERVEQQRFGGNSWNTKILVTTSWLSSGTGSDSAFPNSEVYSRPAFQVTLGVSDIRLRHIEPEGGKTRPGLFEKIEEAPCPTADVEKSQFALVPSGENFMELRRGLPARRIGSPVEEHLDLRVISTRRIVRHPATRLEMEIPQIVAWPLSARLLGQDFVVCTALATPMDFGEILEKKPRAVEESQQRSVMIGRKRVNASLDIGEVLLEKNGHVRVKASAVRHRQIDVGVLPRFLTISSLRRLG